MLQVPPTPQMKGILQKQSLSCTRSVQLPDLGASARAWPWMLSIMMWKLKSSQIHGLFPNLQCSFHLHQCFYVFFNGKTDSSHVVLDGMDSAERPGCGILCGARFDPDHSFPQAPEMDQSCNLQHAGAPFATCQLSSWIGGPAHLSDHSWADCSSKNKPSRCSKQT